jgi:hypothetical protein
MNTGSLNFFANYRPTNFNNKLNCYFNFENSGHNLLKPSLGKYKNIITGYILPNTENFWTYKPNVGFISGNYIKLENIKNTDFNFKNFSCIFSCEKLNYNGGVLLSSINKSIQEFLMPNGNLELQEYYKGFEFGITANNYLYFEYFKNTGPDISISDHKINDKSVIYLNIVNNNVNYGCIDFNTRKMINKSFTVSSDYFFDPTELYIGYNPSAEFLYSNNQNFVGYFEDIILTSPFLFDYEIINISSGFIYNFNSGFQYTTNFITTGITGSYSAITGYEMRITGYERIATGEFTNPWGVTVMGFINQPLTVQVPLSGVFYLSGEIINIFTGFSGVSFSKDNEKFLSYQKNVINILNKVDAEDLIEFNFITGYSNPIFNKKNIFIEYDRVSNTYQNLTRNENFYNIFVNGQLQKSGNLYFSKSPYGNNTLIIENDYGLDRQNRDRIIFNNFYGLKGESSVFIDVNTSGNLTFQNIENYPYLNFDNNKYDLFLNGQKLTKGIHYNEANYNFNYKYFISGTRKAKLTDNLILIKGDNKVLIYTGSMSNGWNLKQEIINPSPTEDSFLNSYFGFSFDISENYKTIAIGWPIDSYNNSGSIFIYTGDILNEWAFKQKLTGASFIQDFIMGTYFGSDVYVNYDGSIIIGGQPSDAEGGLELNFYPAGGASIFTGNNFDGWNFKQKILGNSGDRASKVVSNYDNTILALNSRGGKIYTGNLNDGWTFKNKISIDADGKDIAINKEGNKLFIGETFIIESSPEIPPELFNKNVGSIYIYTGNENYDFNLNQIIKNTQTGSQIIQLDSAFGDSIEISYNNILSVFDQNYGFISNNGYLSDAIIFLGGLSIYSGDNNNNWNLIQFLTGSGVDYDEFEGVEKKYSNHTVNRQNGDFFIFLANNFKSLIIGLDEVDSTKYYFNDQYSGNLTAIPKTYDLNSFNFGTPILDLPQNFYYNTTELYINGIRQTLNYDYLELSSKDISSGLKILLENNKDYIYNNEGFIK